MKWPNSQDKSPSAYLDGAVVCEVVDECEEHAPFSVGVASIAACDLHAGVEWHEVIRARDDYRGDRELRDLGDRLQAEDDLHDAGGCDPASCPVCAELREERPGDLTADDYDRLFGPPDPDDDDLEEVAE